MTDTDRINWMERAGANVAPDMSEGLIPTGYCVCAYAHTEWIFAPTLREAIDQCAAKYQRVIAEN